MSCSPLKPIPSVSRFKLSIPKEKQQSYNLLMTFAHEKGNFGD
jgi:hypothetical protein